MTDDELTQAEADSLIAVKKIRVDDKTWNYPGLGGSVSIPLTSIDGRERFILDMRRGRIDLAKGSYQNRGRRVVPLVRLCFGGSPHVNLNDEEVESPHLHIYREGYGDKWALPPPDDKFPNLGDQWRTFHNFMRLCNIVTPPNVRRELSI